MTGNIYKSIKKKTLYKVTDTRDNKIYLQNIEDETDIRAVSPFVISRNYELIEESKQKAGKPTESFFEPLDEVHYTKTTKLITEDRKKYRIEIYVDKFGRWKYTRKTKDRSVISGILEIDGELIGKRLSKVQASIIIMDTLDLDGVVLK